MIPTNLNTPENQNAVQTVDNSTVQAVRTQVNPKTNYKIYAYVVFVCFLVFGLGGYYLGKQSHNISYTEVPDLQTPASLMTTTPIISSSVLNTKTLAESLSENCIDGKINTENLPFVLSQNLKTTYNLQNAIDCYASGENYAVIAIVNNNFEELDGENRYIYFFHNNSKFQGAGNYFQPMTNYLPVTINGQSLYIDVREPGPYGISTLGVWVDFISEMRDPKTDTIVRAFNLKVFKDQDIMELVKKYGIQQTEQGVPEYVIIDPVKKAQFVQELARLASEPDSFKRPAQSVVMDLNGIDF